MPSERSALIAAIREAPDDDALRLICADWFEDQGDEASMARAEFIRIQIRRASLPPDDLEQSDLAARELRLLRRYGPAWCGSHFAFKKVRFRRGFIEYVHLHLGHFLHHRRQMLALEPVRDVRLTGWHRAPDDLIRRVAGCEEWKYVQTLRIHHQGPHKDPRGNLLLLLESPHLTRLRALHCPLVQFDADARRRFERLPVLRQVEELRLPSLSRWPQNPGEWFSDGGPELAGEWAGLRSLKVTGSSGIGLLRRFSEMAFWDRLTAMELILPIQKSEALSVLRDRMPNSLRELCLHVGHAPDFSAADSFFERLSQVPVQVLYLGWVPISPGALGRLLDRTNRWDLRELSLPGCDLTEEHARVLAAAPGLQNLLSLDLTGNLDFGPDAARALFCSDRLRSLVHLDLTGTPIRTAGAVALAGAPGWNRLRSLNLLGAYLETDGLRALLASPNAHRLNWLTVGDEGGQDEPAFDVPPDVAAELTRLPNLGYLRLSSERCDPRTQEILSAGDSLAWALIECYGDMDVQTRRAWAAPDRWPPLDAAQEDRFVLT